MNSLDIKLFYAINGLAGKSHFWDQVAIYTYTTKYSITIFSIILAIYFFKNRKIFWSALLSAALSRGIITEAIRYFYHRPRPFKALEGVHLLTRGNLVFQYNDLEASFPSGHAAFLFAIAFAVYLYNKKIGVILILVALFMSIARIYVGVHYPSDILGGIVVAVMSVYAVRSFRRQSNFKKI